MDSYKLYTQHAPLVEKLLRRFGVRAAEIEDARQDAFERIHRRFGDFEGRAKIETWVYAFCWRVAAEYRRRARRAYTADPETVAALAEWTPPQTSPTLERLEPADRDLFALHEVGELSITALSDLTGSTRTKIRKRIEKARARIEHHPAPPGYAVRRGPNMPQTGSSMDEQRVLELARDCDGQEYVCPRYAISRCGPLVFALWHTTPDARAYARMCKIMLATAQRFEILSFLAVVNPAAEPPDAESRAIQLWLMHALSHRLAGAAFVDTGSEFRHDLPAIMNSLAFLSARPFEMRIFSNIPAALQWLLPLTPALELTSITAHCERLHALLLSAAF